MGGRPFRFVYFGGGTPSFLSAKQLTSLVDRLRANINWDQAEEVTFECEPGTLSQPKLRTLKELGVTRLSLGVENFSDAVLEENGREQDATERGNLHGHRCLSVPGGGARSLPNDARLLSLFPDICICAARLSSTTSLSRKDAFSLCDASRTTIFSGSSVIASPLHPCEAGQCCRLSRHLTIQRTIHITRIPARR